MLDNWDNFWYSVAAIWDFDANRVPDIVVWAINDDDGWTDKWAIWILLLDSNWTVISNQKISDTQWLFEWTIINWDQFWTSLANLWDINSDNVTDIAVWAMDDDWGLDRGAIWVLNLNNNWTVSSYQKISNTQWSFSWILNNNDYFWNSLSSIWDLNKDWITDIVTTAKQDDDGAIDQWAVWILNLNWIVDTIKIDNESPLNSNPATMSSVTASSTSSLIIEANEVTDEGEGSVFYSFQETTWNSWAIIISDWQTWNVLTDTWLSVNTNYCYKVQTRDWLYNTWSWTTTWSCAYTLANTPEIIEITNISTKKVQVLINTGWNPPDTEYLIEVDSDWDSIYDSYANSSWSTQTWIYWSTYENFNGATWTNIWNLTPEKAINIKIKARNWNNVETPYSSEWTWSTQSIIWISVLNSDLQFSIWAWENVDTFSQVQISTNWENWYVLYIKDNSSSWSGYSFQSITDDSIWIQDFSWTLDNPSSWWFSDVWVWISIWNATTKDEVKWWTWANQKYWSVSNMFEQIHNKDWFTDFTQVDLTQVKFKIKTPENQTIWKYYEIYTFMATVDL